MISEQLRAAGVQGGPPGDFGVPDEEVDIRADVSAFAEPKRKAVAAQRPRSRSGRCTCRKRSG